MLSKDARSKIQEAQGGSKLIGDRVKVSSDELIGKTLTIADYESLGRDYTDEKGKEHHHYYVVLFEELEGNFTLSGSALTSILDMAESMGEDARGEKVLFEKTIRTKEGNNYNPVKLL